MTSFANDRAVNPIAEALDMCIQALLFLDDLEQRYEAIPPWAKRLEKVLGPTRAGTKLRGH